MRGRKGSIKRIFPDTECTGLYAKKHGLVQIAGVIEIDGEVKGEFNLHAAPFPQDEITEEALDIIGKTEAEIRSYPPPREAFAKLLGVLDAFVDRYDPEDKLWWYGYRADYDRSMVSEWFKKCGDPYFGSWFHSPVIDVLPLVVDALLPEKASGALKDFKLTTVADHWGITPPEGEAHDALYDARILHGVYHKWRGLWVPKGEPGDGAQGAEIGAGVPDGTLAGLGGGPDIGGELAAEADAAAYELGENGVE